MSGPTAPPLPEQTDLTRFYWDAAREGRLELLRCRACRHFVHYPRPICDRCQSTDLGPEQISGRGTLYSYCTVIQPAHPYFADKVPYVVGVVEIDEEPGVRIPTGIVDDDGIALRCGLEVEVTFRSVGAGFVLPFFRPRPSDR